MSMYAMVRILQGMFGFPFSTCGKESGFIVD